MRDPVRHRATGDAADIDRQVLGIIRQCGDALKGVCKLDDGVGAMVVLAARMRPPPGNLDSPGAPALARHDHQMLLAQAPFRFKNQRRQGVPVKAAAAQITEVRREPLLR